MHIRNITLFILLYFLSISVKTQTYFNIAADLGLVNNHFRDFIVHDDTIVCLGLARADTINWRQGLLVAKFDSSGNLLASNILVDSLGSHLSIDRHFGKITRTSDGGYALTGATVDRKDAFLFKLDRNLQEEFRYEYVDTINLSNYNYQAPIEISDGYILYGSIQRPNYYNDPFIRRVDKQGNPVWFNYYGEFPFTHVFNDAHLRSDSTIVLSGGKGLNANTGISIITIVNLSGTVIDYWESPPNPEIGALRKILPLDDGGFITYGLYLTDFIFNTLIVQPTLARLDSNFQTQWVLHFDRALSISAFAGLRKIHPTSDGNYIGAGETFVTENGNNRRVGWLFKFTPQGDSLWSRYIDPPFSLDGEYSISGWFGGVGELSGGNIVAGGATSKGIYYYGWLVKTDADGCMEEEPCEVVNSFSETLPRIEGPRLFPNPVEGASAWFVLEWPAGPPAGEARFYLIDAQGRVVWQTHRRLEGVMEFRPGALPGGMYFLAVETQEGRWVRKLAVR
jgi:hypothetical protein